LRELLRYAGTQFDPELVKAFIDALRRADIKKEGGALSIA
jgi:HD-GYP domain-containing protein (c-di-GMP phosphodiesterase class II)